MKLLQAPLNRLVTLVLTLTLAPALAAAAELSPTDTTLIEKITGLKGTYTREEDAFKISRPRNDVPVQVDGMIMSPFMGLTSWAAFTPGPDGHLMMMGDTVLFEDEVNPVMSVALDSGLDVTALHNHFFYDQPRVYFMHLAGMGSAVDLATGVNRIYEKIAQIRGAHPAPARTFADSGTHENRISPATLDAIFGIKGETKDGMYKMTVGRTTAMGRVTVGKTLGVNSWAGFAGNDDEAITDGDLAVQERELQPVLKILRSGNINIVAIHHHMVDESPRILFLHFWGKGKAADLAKTLRKAINSQGQADR